jgi:hypothetical protein
MLVTRRILSMGAPLVAIFAGIVAARPSGVSISAFLPNILAVLLGIPIVLTLSHLTRSLRNNRSLITTLTIVLLCLSLIQPGLESVHRWVKIGPVFFNVSMALTPVILYSMVYGTQLTSVCLAIIMSLIYVSQPDAGQATAFACASLLIFIAKASWGLPPRLIGMITVVSAATIAWLRPDPLEPVQHVERIFHLALSQGVLCFSLCLCTVLASLLPFVWIFRDDPGRELRLLSLVYLVFLLTEFSVTEFGNFPVPLLGAGAAPVLGWYIMFGLLLKASSGHKSNERSN